MEYVLIIALVAVLLVAALMLFQVSVGEKFNELTDRVQDASGVATDGGDGATGPSNPPPGQGGTPPGQGGTPPGQGTPPGRYP